MTWKKTYWCFWIQYHTDVTKNNILLQLKILEDVEKSPNGVPSSPTAHTAENAGFVITCTECKKPRLLHSRKKIKDDVSGAKRMMGKVTYMCGACAEFMVNGSDKDERFLNTVFVRANISCKSKIELPYHSVACYPLVCIYCGIGGTHRTLDTSVEYYLNCTNCHDQPNVARRKRKTVMQDDFNK